MPASTFQLPDPPALMRGLPEPYFSTLVRGVRRAAATRPGGVVDLARGNPELPPPAHAVEALRAAALDPAVHGYPPFDGIAELVSAFVDHQREVFGVELDAEREVVVVPGTKTAINLLCMALAGPGDAVLIPDPGYPDYFSGVGVAGARVAQLPLDPHASFAPDWSSVAWKGARMAFLNYPSNPCGTCATPELFGEAVRVAAERGVPIVHDLAYGELVFGGREPLSFLATDGAKDVGVELVSASKTWCMAGWRVGFVAGNEHIVARVRTLLDHMAVGVFAAVQRGLVAALRGPQHDVAQMRGNYERRSRRVADVVGCAPAEGSYYSWWQLPPHLTVDSLLHDHGVALAPGEGFGSRGQGWARISVAVSDEQLGQGLSRIAAAL